MASKSMGNTPGRDSVAAHDEDPHLSGSRHLSVIESWKVNQALYRQYGGHVIFQQGGPEPLDAYRQLLTEEAKRGSFTIADKALEASFWAYFTNDAEYIVSSDDEAERAFSKPWWMD